MQRKTWYSILGLDDEPLSTKLGMLNESNVENSKIQVLIDRIMSCFIIQNKCNDLMVSIFA